MFSNRISRPDFTFSSGAGYAQNKPELRQLGSSNVLTFGSYEGDL